MREIKLGEEKGIKGKEEVRKEKARQTKEKEERRRKENRRNENGDKERKKIIVGSILECSKDQE